MIRRTGALAIIVGLCASGALAHEPYVTDDPDPVAWHHTEIFVATQSFWTGDGDNGVAPYFELNYGAIPDVELHLQLPMNYDRPRPGGRSITDTATPNWA